MTDKELEEKWKKFGQGWEEWRRWMRFLENKESKIKRWSFKIIKYNEKDGWHLRHQDEELFGNGKNKSAIVRQFDTPFESVVTKRSDSRFIGKTGITRQTTMDFYSRVIDV